jgi:hypothetical protein
MNCSFLKCLSLDLSHIAHKGYNVVVKVKIVHSMLNSLLMLMLIWLEYTNVKRLKNMSKITRKGIWMDIMRCHSKCKLRVYMATMLIHKEHLWRLI